MSHSWWENVKLKCSQSLSILALFCYWMDWEEGQYRMNFMIATQGTPNIGQGSRYDSPSTVQVIAQHVAKSWVPL